MSQELAADGRLRTGRRDRLADLASVALPALVFVLHAMLFVHWVVDDAGISFAYARNLGRGHGLVSQPGVAPCEGYSNLTWVLLLTPLSAAGLFDPIVTPKVVSIVLVLGSFWVLGRTLRRGLACGRVAVAVVLLTIATNPSFAIWTTSGLENPLTVLLLCVLLAGLTRHPGSGGVAGATLLGLAACLLAWTRPDGIVFAAAFPLLVLGGLIARRGRGLGRGTAHLLGYGLAFALSFGALLWLRWWYFHDVFPNTYYAKGGPGLGTVASLLLLAPEMVSKMQHLSLCVGGRFGNVQAVAILIATTVLLAGRRFDRQLWGLAVCFVLGAVVFCLLPYDWMAEYRFATPFIVFFYAYLVVVLTRFIQALPVRAGAKAAAMGLLLAGLVAGGGLMVIRRSLPFAEHPAVPFTEVGRIARRFNRCAEHLGLDRASILAPDLGGQLWYSDLRVYDLAGLCDPTIARTLRRRKGELYDYVFAQVRPTFIHTHSDWSLTARLRDDERLARDYIAIREYTDPSVRDYDGREVTSGDYVRKDAVAGRAGVLARIRREFEGVGAPFVE